MLELGERSEGRDAFAELYIECTTFDLYFHVSLALLVKIVH